MNVTTASAPLAIAMSVLVLFLAMALVLIPVLDELLRRQVARRAIKDTEPPEARRG